MSKDLGKIIKRLELIKSLIALEEESDIAAQIDKLEAIEFILPELTTIVDLLKARQYSTGMALIQKFLTSYNQASTYIDAELQGSKLEAKILEIEVNDLSNEKADLEKLIHSFGLRHSEELGELIITILEKLKQSAQGTSDEAEAEQDYQDYSENYASRSGEKYIELSNEDQKAIQQMYRNASKLCHPDLVDDTQKVLANQIFFDLNEFYKRNDVNCVKEIFGRLQERNILAYKFDAINDNKVLQEEIVKLRLLLNTLKCLIEALKDSEAYQAIVEIYDWDHYFAKTKEALSNIIRMLSVKTSDE